METARSRCSSKIGITWFRSDPTVKTVQVTRAPARGDWRETAIAGKQRRPALKPLQNKG